MIRGIYFIGVIKFTNNIMWYSTVGKVRVRVMAMVILPIL